MHAFNRRFVALPLWAIALACFPAIAAAVPAISFTTPHSEFHDTSYSIGWEFNILADTRIGALGFFDDFAQNGLTESHEVGIFNAAGSLLVSTTIDPSDQLDGFFRYHRIPAITLPIGNGYRIAALNGSERYAYQVSNFAEHPNVDFVTNRYTVSTTLVFPESQSGNDNPGYFGPNFQVVPEPACALLAAIGGLMSLPRRAARCRLPIR